MAPLRHLSFRLLVAGQLVSNFGDAIYAVALSWYVLAHHGGALLLGTVLAAYGCHGPRCWWWAATRAIATGRGR